MSLLRASARFHRPPSFLYGLCDDWPGILEDRLLIASLESYEASVCGGCGQPLQRSMDPDSRGEWQIEHVRCNACAVIEADRAKDQKLPAGTKTRLWDKIRNPKPERSGPRGRRRQKRDSPPGG